VYCSADAGPECSSFSELYRCLADYAGGDVERDCVLIVEDDR
jgi:hypothetical protein